MILIDLLKAPVGENYTDHDNVHQTGQLAFLDLQAQRSLQAYRPLQALVGLITHHQRASGVPCGPEPHTSSSSATWNRSTHSTHSQHTRHTSKHRPPTSRLAGHTLYTLIVSGHTHTLIETHTTQPFRRFSGCCLPDRASS